MCPRPRSVSDAEVLAATARVIARVGSASLTLAHVGAEVGLAPATLLQRFGSKRGLLLALAKSSADRVEGMFEEVRADQASPVAALIAAASLVAQAAETPGELVNQLVFRQADLQDPDFHQCALENARRIRDGYRRLVVEAIGDGELSDCDPDVLARAVESIAGGALASWVVHRDGDAATFVRREVATLLRGYGRGAWARS